MEKKAATIQYFSAMDIGMLELVLDDEKTYQDAVKETFLSKLAQSFETFKRAGDTALVPQAGTCTAKECNFGCKGFSFVGNCSGKRLDLVFEEDETDYTDIYYCHQLQSAVPREEYSDKVYLHIGKDERADFTPSVDYLLTRSKCESAYDEMMQHRGSVLQEAVYSAWLEKYAALNDSLPGILLNYSGFDPFKDLFRDLSEVLAFLPYEKEAAQALLVFEDLPSNEEKGILLWLVKYEKLGEQIALFLFNDEMEYSDTPASLAHNHELFIDPGEFSSFVGFSRLYDMHRKMTDDMKKDDR